MSHAPSRGPSDLEIAMAANTQATIDALDLEQRIERTIRELHRTQEAVRALGHTPMRPTFGRPMNAAAQVVQGVAFWDRDVADEVPSGLKVAG